MAFRIGIVGPPNSGKSFSRSTIPDGENAFVIAASYKAAYLKTSEGTPVKSFNVVGQNFTGFEEAKVKLNVQTNVGVLKKLYEMQAGKLKRKNLTGNLSIVKDLNHLSTWIKFISKQMPWIHTIILPDFTHYISEVISSTSFIERKQGGDAYQRFWELAGSALRNFITVSDQIRDDIMIVTEFHAEYNAEEGQFEIFTPGGKMLTEKFLPASYYDVLLYTHVEMPEDETEAATGFKFVTKPTKRYRDARCMNLFEDTYIENDLNLVITKVRELVGLPQPTYEEK